MSDNWIPADERKTFGQVIKLMCKDKKISQTKLAEMAGIGKNSLIGYVTGKHKPTLSVIVSICDVLDVSADVLLGRISYIPDGWYLIGEEIVE